MAHQMHKLTVLTVAKAKPGKTYGDGGNLYLQVSNTGGKYWVYRWMAKGETETQSIGPARLVSLSEARQQALAWSQLRLKGGCPKALKAAAAPVSPATKPIFRQVAESYINSHAPGWRSKKHGDQWRSTLEAHAYGILGHLPVDQIDVVKIKAVLDPIWSTIPVTADRVRQRIEAILDSATALGYRTAANPARWKGGLKSLLPPKSKVRKTRHFPALATQQLPAFMSRLRRTNEASSLALQFLVLTATRTSETLRAQWDEIDLKQKIWTIPAARTKTAKPHIVPLSPRAISILNRIHRVKGNPFIFPGRKKGMPLSNMAFLALRNRLGMQHITIHGFRSTFRDWAATNGYSREIAEMALSHVVGNKVEAAYLRTTLVENRRDMMNAWAKYSN